LDFNITEEIVITNPLKYGFIAFLALVVIEIIVSLKRDKHLYDWKDLTSSASMGLGALLITSVVSSLPLLLFFPIYEFFNPIVGDTRMNIMGWEAFHFTWLTFLICQILDDHNYYWHHRLSHTIRCLWAAHIVHHSSDHYNLGTGLRNGWVTLFYKPLLWCWLPLVGFHPMMVYTCLGIQALWQFQLHTKFIPDLGFFEKFINTHRQHQVHHARNIEYLDKNHGGYLNLFDRMYGSHGVLDPEQEVQFGVIHPPNSYNPLIIVSHEYKNIWNDVRNTKNWRHKLMYIFGPPGWSPDGSTKTVRQMQRELKRQKKINKLIPIKDIEESILNGKPQLVPEPKAEEEAEFRENSFA
jgi:sterol desaturase/sphingolipid hydroxylase (fatty acid hydroxylase superfamily)